MYMNFIVITTVVQLLIQSVRCSFFRMPSTHPWVSTVAQAAETRETKSSLPSIPRGWFRRDLEFL